MDPIPVTNVIIAGIGGQGVIKASDILADTAFRVGLDVKKSEIHGMSQRGGSVASDVRFGGRVLSPTICAGEADFLVVVAPDQVENNRHLLRPGGRLIEPAWIDEAKLDNRRSLNVALLGALGAYLDLPHEAWLAAVRHVLPERFHEVNLKAFDLGRQAAAGRN